MLCYDSESRATIDEARMCKQLLPRARMCKQLLPRLRVGFPSSSSSNVMLRRLAYLGFCAKHSRCGNSNSIGWDVLGQGPFVLANGHIHRSLGHRPRKAKATNQLWLKAIFKRSQCRLISINNGQCIDSCPTVASSKKTHKNECLSAANKLTQQSCSSNKMP